MKIAVELQEQMGAMGEASYPNEGCGILIGNFGSEIEVVEVRSATNLRSQPSQRRQQARIPTRTSLILS